MLPIRTMDAVYKHLMNLFTLCVVIFSQCSKVQAKRRNIIDISHPIKTWPKGIIPYLISDKDYDESQMRLIRAAMDRWEQRTCIKFVPWTPEVKQQLDGERRFIRFFKGKTCFSRYGMHRFQPQLIGIADSCMDMQTIIHELGHVIGMVHTMERTDRDDYIEINYANVNPDSRRNYDTTMTKGYSYDLHGTPYDYKSIMHYGPKAWSRNGRVVMVTRDPAYQTIIGHATDVSFYDAAYVNRAYNCSAVCPDSDLNKCWNGGTVGGSDCQCLCPDGFVGEFCEQRLKGYHRIIDWRCQKGWRFSNGKCVKVFPSVNIGWQTALELCQQNDATLPVFKTRYDVTWMSQLMAEEFALSTTKSFWVGIKRRGMETTYQNIDGSGYNDTLLPLHELGTGSNDGCGTTDGKAITVSSCSTKEFNSVLCMKDFDENCGGKIQVTSRGVSIKSPGFPGTYPNGMTCRYILKASARKNIELTFHSFSLENSNNCNKDSLEIQKNSDFLNPGKKYCGLQLSKETLTSRDNTVILTFKSNDRNSEGGFKLTAKAKPRRKSFGGRRVPAQLLHSLFDNVGPDERPRTSDKPEFLQSLWDMLGSMSVSSLL